MPFFVAVTAASTRAYPRRALEAMGREVDQHQMVVGAPRDDYRGHGEETLVGTLCKKP